MKKEYPYWIAFSQLPRMTNLKKNSIIIKLHEMQSTLVDFFHFDEKTLKSEFELNDKELINLAEQKKELPNFSFIAEDLLNQGYDIIPIISPEYSPTMKSNLKKKYSPPLIYTKGNKKIMKEESIAIVGSRKAGKRSLEFTDNVAKKASEKFKVIVSGFAKGVDKQALDSAIKHKGQSIIVLPQGIMTYASGFKKYYKYIAEGDVLVLSTFFPKSPWSVQLAMARNPIIYGLAKEIYVAESSNKGGTWSGVHDGLKKGREIYIRIPEENEKNANNILIEKGGTPVDFYGEPVEQKTVMDDETQSKDNTSDINEIDERICSLLSKGEYTSKEIVEKLKIDWKPHSMTSYLKKKDEILLIKEKPLKFTTKKSNSQISLFG